ncbi:MAG: phytanoyl-CoA dioxygenase [Acidobacteria bacterium]|nr:MAG: phytanoyl-CoA dioxygenase [Acidobacteriota bacterium]REK06307.1 MAG: phytanoyl-CoA dioxygenase [Acidobacteriota bacterium]
MGVTPEQIEEFIAEGFVRVDEAFPVRVADEALKILWRDTGLERGRPESWTQPVVWLGEYDDVPFRAAATAPRLTAAFDALVGEGRWISRSSLGAFPVRFPSESSSGDDGWHVDASFPGQDPTSYFDWRINYLSRGRALLMLFLFSDVGPDDAPTRLRSGSHLDVARLLHGYGEDGLSFNQLAAELQALPERPETMAVGGRGTVYLCHPFLVHAAQRHRGRNPRFMAQPALLAKGSFELGGPSPVERAIARGIGAGAG